MSIFTEKDRQYSREWATGKTMKGRPTGFMENLTSSWTNFVNNETQSSTRDNMRELVQKRIATVQELTGIEIEDPYSNVPSWLQAASPDALPAGSDETFLGAVGAAIDPMRLLFDNFSRQDGGTEEARLLAHEDAINEARVRLPEEQWHLIPTVEQLREQMQKEAAEIEARNADIASRATFGGIAGQLAGGMGAAVTQPEILATLPLGAPARVGFVQRLLTEAAIGAGTEAAIQPGVQANREALGLESGIDQALENIALAAGGTAALTGISSAAMAVVRGGARAFEARFGRPPTQAEQAAIDVARQAVENERAQPYEQRTAAAAHVYRENEQAATIAALEGRAVRDAELEEDRELVARAVTQGAALRTFTNEDLDQIGVDADLMQFKAGGDESGVTDRLRGVKTWEIERAGIALVYEYADGRMIIADGHQRLGLAQRLAAEGQNIEMPAIVIREIEGATPQEARARAAFKNIAEGTGTATDAAKVLRDLGARAEDLNLPPKSALVRDAEGLTALNDEVFGMVINEILPERFAAIIGRLIDDSPLQTNIAQLLARLRPANAIEAEQIVMQARAAGVSRGTQSTLFGEEDIAESLYLERARVLDRSLKMLRRNQSTFRTLLDQEGEISGVGNQLDQNANQARLDADRMLTAYIQAQANRKGMIGDALTEAARLAKETGQYQGPARQFVQALSRAIEEGEIARGIGRADGDAAEFAAQDPARAFEQPVDVIPDEQTFSMFGDPTGDAAARQANAIDAEVRDRIEAENTGIVQPSIGEPVSVAGLPDEAITEVKYRFKMDAPARTIDEIYATAQRWQDELAQIGRTIGRRKGVKFKNPGLKARETTVAKVTRKNYRDTRELTDIVRGGFVVETPAQADAAVATLGQRFRVLDEGWEVTPEGYFDRKVLVKFDDGTIGEVQFWHPEMLETKSRAGHKLYAQMRNLDASDPRYGELMDQQRALYAEAMGKMDDQWRSVAGDFISGNAGGRPGNRVANRSAESSEPESATSSSRADSQASELSGTTQADDPTMIAGRPSQSTNDVLDIETPFRNVRASDGEEGSTVLYRGASADEAGGLTSGGYALRDNQLGVMMTPDRGTADYFADFNRGEVVEFPLSSRAKVFDRGSLGDNPPEWYEILEAASNRPGFDYSNQEPFIRAEMIERGFDAVRYKSRDYDVFEVLDPRNFRGDLEVEPGAEGLPQTLMPGVRPVSDADRMALDVDRPLDGGARPMDTGLFGESASQQDLMDILGQPERISRLEAMEIPMGERIDVDGNRVSEVQTVRQILDELEEDQNFIEQLDLCDRSSRP